MTISNIPSKATGPIVTEIHIELREESFFFQMVQALFMVKSFRSFLLCNQRTDCLKILYVAFGTGVIPR